jgi:penicillin-binding protein 1C
MVRASILKRAGLLLIAAAVLALPLVPAFLTPGVYLPSFPEVRSSYRKSEAALLDREHRVIHEMRVDARARRLEWTSLEEISPALRKAIVQAEDRRFYRHGGIDWVSLGGAFLGALSSDNLRGASTITMQVAARLRPELQPAGSRRSWWQKCRQVLAARALEKQWSKEQILEAYLNLVTYRGELQGIAAAAGGLFQKQPHGLNDLESIVLAALVRAPNAPIEQVARRARMLAGDLALDLDPAQIESAARETLSRPYYVRPQVALAPHVAARLLRRASEPARVVSTLDGRLQQFALEVVARHLITLASQNVHDGAALVVENTTGDVLAYVGNSGAGASAPYVDGVQARRQAGSTLKPFLYALALEQRLLTAASLIEDSPLDVPVAGGVYRPQNYDSQFHGLLIVRTALASSLNVPAVKTLNMVGVEPFVQRLTALGFSGLRAAEYYGPSLALGAADVTLWELVNAYRSLANGGFQGSLKLEPGEQEGPRPHVFSAEAAYIISDILSDRESRSRTFSLESPLATRFWTAVKTGTSKDMRDNWCVGYSDRYTVGVWSGNFSGEPMWNVSGVTGAAPVWVELMNYLHQDSPSNPPQPPKGIRGRAIRIAETGQEYHEWFLTGTETALVRRAMASANFRIAYPADGTVVALDPDIPADEQRLFFEARPGSDDNHWILNGQELGPAGSLHLWKPRKGAYTLSLIDSANCVLDTVSFQVRGNLPDRP